MPKPQIILSEGLTRIYSLDNVSFRSIQPNEEVTVGINYNSGDLKTLMQDFSGELTIVSEHHNLRRMPIKIEWNKIDGEHFTVYARSGDESVAKSVMDVLEQNYQNVTSSIGEMKSKAAIYIASSMDEMKLVNPSGNPYYSYTEDAIFVCACDDTEYGALTKFIYRIMINEHTSYHNMKKFMFDQENWLIDGISGYIAAGMTNTTQHVDAFTNSTTTFQWFGYGSDAQYGATFTFFEYLENQYGNEVIGEIVNQLGSGMIMNHRCDTLENCAVLQAVYDVNGMNIEDQRKPLSVEQLIGGWKEYVTEQ